MKLEVWKAELRIRDFWNRWLAHRQSLFVRQSFGWLDVLFNEGLVCIISF